MKIFFSFFIENGGWSEWIHSSDEECFLQNDEWVKPKKRTCSNPEPKYGGICHQENNLLNVTLENCEPSKYMYYNFYVGILKKHRILKRKYHRTLQDICKWHDMCLKVSVNRF